MPGPTACPRHPDTPASALLAQPAPNLNSSAMAGATGFNTVTNQISKRLAAVHFDAIFDSAGSSHRPRVGVSSRAWASPLAIQFHGRQCAQGFCVSAFSDLCPGDGFATLRLMYACMGEAPQRCPLAQICVCSAPCASPHAAGRHQLHLSSLMVILGVIVAFCPRSVHL